MSQNYHSQEMNYLKKVTSLPVPFLDLKNSGLEVLAINQKSLIKEENSDNRFACGKCHKSYKNKRHLYRHVKEECVDVAPRFQCDICFTLFRRKYHLIRHMENKHSFVNPKHSV